MILACGGCDSRYDVTGYPVGQQFRCRCGTITTLAAPSPQAGLLACPHCGAGVAPSAKTCAHCSHELLLKACPRCLSRVFHGHKHCPDCGAELSLVATVEPREDRPCPRCETEQLGGRLVGDVVVDECLVCHGLWLDHIAVKRIITDRQQARAESLMGALPTTLELKIQTGGKMYIKCPVCRQIMNRTLFATGSGVVIDVCKLHGAFFDIGELPRVIEYVMQGGLERAERKEIDQQKAQLAREQHAARVAAIAVSRNAGAQAASRGGALVDLLFRVFR